MNPVPTRMDVDYGKDNTTNRVRFEDYLESGYKTIKNDVGETLSFKINTHEDLRRDELDHHCIWQIMYQTSNQRSWICDHPKTSFLNIEDLSTIELTYQTKPGECEKMIRASFIDVIFPRFFVPIEPNAEPSPLPPSSSPPPSRLSWFSKIFKSFINVSKEEKNTGGEENDEQHQPTYKLNWVSSRSG